MATRKLASGPRPLTKGLKKFHELLKKSSVNQVITRQTLLKETSWSDASLDTYLGKNKLDTFLVAQPDGKFRIVKAGPSLPEADVAGALSQVTPEALLVRSKDTLRTSCDSYELVRELGRGAVGHVWEARAKSSGILVAAKIVSPRPDLIEPTAFQNVKERFRREAVNGLSINDQHIVRYIDMGEFQGAPFLCMQLAEESVASKLTSISKMSLRESATVVEGCAKGLKFLHSRNCIHRDVKPANILLRAGAFMLGDLGIVKWSDLNTAFTGAGTVTRASVQLGSWFYMAPEQLDAPHEATAASDIYALGVTWYQLLTGDTRTPAAFAAQSFPAPTSNQAVSRCISAMVNYDAAKRPSLDYVVGVARKSV